jgi:SEC-C motif-containing protein
MALTSGCPCGSGETYAACCGPFHSGEAAPPTATALMRSRFSAFATGDAGYLLQTWDPSTRPAVLDLDDRIRWTQLEIVAAVRGGLLETTGIVEFRAHYRATDGWGTLHERSTFTRRGGRWMYVSAEV